MDNYSGQDMAVLQGFEGDKALVLFDQARTRVNGAWKHDPYESLMGRDDLVKMRDRVRAEMELQAGVITQGLSGTDFRLAAANLGRKQDTFAFYTDAIKQLDQHMAGARPAPAQTGPKMGLDLG